MKKFAAVSIAAVMSMGALAGCGGSDDSSSKSYCDDVSAAKSQFQSMASSSFSSNFDELNDAVKTISD